MTKRKTGVKLSPKEVRRGRQYPDVSGRIVDWADHKFEEGILFIRVSFYRQDGTLLAIHHFLMLEEADLSA
jgi:hypothetical protein